MLNYRKATIDDVGALSRFTDYWLAGRGKRVNAPGAVDDYFISPSQHLKYVQKYVTWVVLENEAIIAWAVQQADGALIHMLVAGTHRGLGIGSDLLRLINPTYIRSKSNQSSGDPAKFYEQHGYHKVRRVKSRGRIDIDKIKPSRKPIIDILERNST
jgi:GNAT superfamily N-acetyltransferase